MKKAIIIILSVIGGLAAAVYIAGVVYGFLRFLPNTYINGTEVSYLNGEDARESILPENREFIVDEITGVSEQIRLSDIDYNIEPEVPAEHLISKQNHFAWPVCFFRDTNLEDALVISFDEQKLVSEIRALDAMQPDNARLPEDAYIDVDDAGHYSIVPEDNGTTLDADKTVSVITKAVADGRYEADMEQEGCYLKAEITSDNEELNYLMNHILALGEEVITINLTEAEESLDTMQLTEMTYFDSDWNLQVDWDALDAYIDELAEKYETYMQTRNFVTTDGRTIQTGGSQSNGIATDTYGFLMDKVETFNAIYYAILSGETQTVDAVWSVPALTRGQDNLDIGNTYIEVSIDRQHLWYYENGQLMLETDVVTGLPTPSRSTPRGLFRIFGKLQNTNLIGEMDGESWNSHVDFWMSVTWDAVGMHDAPWRNAFGGNIYRTNGSHGCINLPLDKERWLYYNVAMDTPVIIY